MPETVRANETGKGPEDHAELPESSGIPVNVPLVPTEVSLYNSRYSGKLLPEVGVNLRGVKLRPSNAPSPRWEDTHISDRLVASK